MRLIDADAIQYTARFTEYGDGTTRSDAIVTADDIDAMPTIDPVKHGKWIADKYTRKCSECESTYWMREGNAWNYCPNCGSKNGGEG